MACNSMAECSAVNGDVVGSTPTTPAVSERRHLVGCVIHKMETGIRIILATIFLIAAFYTANLYW